MFICDDCKREYSPPPEGPTHCPNDGRKLRDAGSQGKSASDVPKTTPPKETNPERTDEPESNHLPDVKPPSKKVSAKAAASTLDDTETGTQPKTAFGWLVRLTVKKVDGALIVKEEEPFAIGAKGVTIGRAEKYADARDGIRIVDDRVSKSHAWIGPEKRGVVVRDPPPGEKTNKSSSNGTFVRKQPLGQPITDEPRVEEETLLTPGDIVVIADHDVAQFRFSKDRPS